MNVLIACEESQRVCKSFREYGHNAFSCDVQPASGGFPEWHIQGDCMRLLFPERYGQGFETADGKAHFVPKWHIIIAHPPCQFLTYAGNRYFDIEKYGKKAIDRMKAREDAFRFFMRFVYAAKENGSRLCIENPLGYPQTAYRPANQIIHPYQFAESVNDSENYVLKRTCLWLHGLPLLRTNDLPKPRKTEFCETMPHRSGDGMNCDEYRRKMRSKTFTGIARAMGAQWGCML